jgi:hypothetical protein
LSLAAVALVVLALAVQVLARRLHSIQSQQSAAVLVVISTWLLAVARVAAVVA